MPNLREFGSSPHPTGTTTPGTAAAAATARTLLEKLQARPLDLRLEVVLADLLAHGYSFDSFVVQPVGLFARRYRRDLGSVTEEVVDQGVQPATVVEVHREGLYDAVPQQLFHQPGDPEARPGVAAMVQDIRTQRRREKASRRFFLPFEQEFYRFRVLLEQEERRYMTNLSAQWYNDVLARFWELDTPLPPRPLTALLHLLPLAHRIVGDLPRVQQVFETILETPVRLRLTDPVTLPAVASAAGSPAAGVPLGLGQLGRDFVLSGDYQEILPALEIKLHSLTPAALAGFLSPNTWQVRALQLLCRYFVSFETDVVLRYELAEDSRSFRLQDEGETAILGYSTVGLEA